MLYTNMVTKLKTILQTIVFKFQLSYFISANEAFIFIEKNFKFAIQPLTLLFSPSFVGKNEQPQSLFPRKMK